MWRTKLHSCCGQPTWCPCSRAHWHAMRSCSKQVNCLCVPCTRLISTMNPVLVILLKNCVSQPYCQSRISLRERHHGWIWRYRLNRIETTEQEVVLIVCRLSKLRMDWRMLWNCNWWLPEPWEDFCKHEILADESCKKRKHEILVDENMSIVSTIEQ
jgi:hypothetical protein